MGAPSKLRSSERSTAQAAPPRKDLLRDQNATYVERATYDQATVSPRGSRGEMSPPTRTTGELVSAGHAYHCSRAGERGTATSAGATPPKGTASLHGRNAVGCAYAAEPWSKAVEYYKYMVRHQEEEEAQRAKKHGSEQVGYRARQCAALAGTMVRSSVQGCLLALADAANTCTVRVTVTVATPQSEEEPRGEINLDFELDIPSRATAVDSQDTAEHGKQPYAFVGPAVSGGTDANDSSKQRRRQRRPWRRFC